MTIATKTLRIAILCGMLLASALIFASHAYAQTTSQDQLRATIKAEITADPRSKTMTQAQIDGLVDALTTQAQKQGLTVEQLTYRPGETAIPSSAAFTNCTDISCSLGQAFGLDGSVPIIPIALLVVAGLFILIYGIMREMGHPHAKA